jgi:hypothetical protein
LKVIASHHFAHFTLARRAWRALRAACRSRSG